VTYIRPQNRIFQTSTIQPTVNVSPRRGVVMAPVAQLIRFGVPAEQAQGRLDYYDGLLDQTFSWPGKPGTSRVSETFTKVFVKDALLQYFTDSSTGGSSITKSGDGPNLIFSSDLNFAANGGIARSGAFKDRDVQAGDVVKVRAINNASAPITLWSTVRSVKGVTVDAVVGSAAAVAGNAGTTSASATPTQTGGGVNCIFATGSAAGYNGQHDGFITDTYTFTVLEGSIGGDLTTAVFRVTSASGLDDVASFSPAATGVAKAVGTRGLTVTFTYTTGSSCISTATSAGISPSNIVVGQVWSYAVVGAHTASAVTAAGTYSGGQDTVYIIEVTRGGEFTDGTPPQITVSTSNGIDQSGPTSVTAAATPVLIGSLGVTGAFSHTGLRKGDKYTIAATAATTGAMKYLELTNNFDSTIDDDTEVDLTLFIRVPSIQLPRNQTWSPPNVSFSTTQTQLTVKSGITLTDPSWTNGGALLRIPLVSEASKGYGVLYVEAQYWRGDISDSVLSFTDVSQLPTLLGGDDSNDNPGYRGVRYALQNGGNNTSTILFRCIANPDDINSWASGFGDLAQRNDVGAIAVCSNDPDVHDLAIAHVAAMGSAINKKFRRVFLPTFATPAIPVVSAGSSVVGHTLPTTLDEAVALFTTSDDPDTTGTQYTRVICTTSNAGFITNGVHAGDIFRFGYGTNGFGGVTYAEYVIAEVVSEEELRLVTGTSVAISVASKGEVWRNTDAGLEAAEFAAQCGADSSETISRIVPDSFESGAESVPGYFACCAWVGLAYGVLPNQGLTNVELLGFSSVQRITRRFSDDNQDTIAAAGGCIITQDPATGRIYTRHAVTTGDTNNISVREEMMVRNKYDVLYAFADAYEPFKGRTNTTDRLVGKIRDLTNAILRSKTDTIINPDLGPQLQSINGDVLVSRDPINQDRINVYASCTGVAPNNGVDLYISF